MSPKRSLERRLTFCRIRSVAEGGAIASLRRFGFGDTIPISWPKSRESGHVPETLS